MKKEQSSILTPNSDLIGVKKSEKKEEPKEQKVQEPPAEKVVEPNIELDSIPDETPFPASPSPKGPEKAVDKEAAPEGVDSVGRRRRRWEVAFS